MSIEKLNYDIVYEKWRLPDAARESLVEDLNYFMELAEDHFADREWAESRAASLIAANILAVLNVAN